MAHRVLAVDGVFVASPDAFPFYVPRVNELGDDPLRGPLRDPDLLGDIAKTYVRILGDAEQHLSVVRQECPCRSLIVA
jgi:hypothetical protein